MSFRRVDKYGHIHYTNKNGMYHREDGPAIEKPSSEFSQSYKAWYINGRPHREDGPAKIWSERYSKYYLNGKDYSKEDWEKEIIKIRLERIKNL